MIRLSVSACRAGFFLNWSSGAAANGCLLAGNVNCDQHRENFVECRLRIERELGENLRGPAAQRSFHTPQRLVGGKRQQLPLHVALPI